MSSTRVWLSVVLFVYAAPNAVVAGPVWEEVLDAGSLPPGAQPTTGSGPIIIIDGELDAVGGDCEDMYLIRVCDPGKFSASTSTTFGGTADFDSQLWLFRQDQVDPNLAFGILANNDTTIADLRSTLLPVPTDPSPILITRGLYYLAISKAGDDPLSAPLPLGRIFDFATPTEISGPDGPGGGQPINDWTVSCSVPASASLPPEHYEIALTGVVAASQPTCTWDLNCDGWINPFDLALLLGDWGKCDEICSFCAADFDDDCAVGAADLAPLLGHWGLCPRCRDNADCDDGSPCTLDECDPEIGCMYTPQDLAPPTILCPPDVILPCSTPIDPAFTGIPIVSDDCDPKPVVGYSDLLEGACPADSTVLRTWTATDAAGNAASCLQVITLTPVCGVLGSGDCCLADGTPGCEDFDCCAAVCAIDPFCCVVTWDVLCAGGAMMLCPICDDG